MSDLKDKQETLSPKVAAMYQAVYDLMLEDVDLNKVKVSDITSKAGIGKGTAYEYFETKDDIIAGAICEYINNLALIVEERMYEKKSFMESMDYLFNIFEEFHKSNEQTVFMKVFLLCIASIHSDFSVKIHEQFLKKNDAGNSMISTENHLRWDCLFKIVEKGVEQGELRDDIPCEYIVFSIISKLATYLMYYGNRGHRQLQDCSMEKIRELLLKEIEDNFTTARSK